MERKSQITALTHTNRITLRNRNLNVNRIFVIGKVGTTDVFVCLRLLLFKKRMTKENIK